jgi:hypothetical protein
MRNITELMREYANMPLRVMRTASVSTDERGRFFSYGLQIARYCMDSDTFFILHEPATTQTTKQHINTLYRFLARKRVRFVPWLTASEHDITDYYAAKLARVEERFSRSRNLGTAREYYTLHGIYALSARDLPPVPAKIHTLAALEGWGI